ncbi:MAG: beta-hexosaminidase [Bacteroidales bacterium]|nr:beta-hexosaminidase [Bacteroidales bacterium]
MKKYIVSLTVALVCGVAVSSASDFNTLIPRPSEMTQTLSDVTMPIGMTVSSPADFVDDAGRFVAAVNAATNLNATLADANGFIALSVNHAIPAEGYTMTISPRGVDIQASSASGAFYALQTIKQLMGANVLAGKPGETAATYALPIGTIKDQPRYEYRGFMLDVSRHFFEAGEIKKMLDLMAVYKLNRFHWHLTDDQGWRLPVKKYPKLTVQGATNRNILRTDFAQQKQWREGEDAVYGPFAYTPEEVHEIVAYAKERHIEVIPEIDMPGHMVAAIHAYPEFSTDPKSKKLDVHEDFSHEIWNKRGVSRDVLDVSNPKVIRFVKDVIDELVEYFPYEYIHIGGDECPTLAWEHSKSCQKLIKKLGLKDVRELQSWFTKEISDYANTHGRKIIVWNEVITEPNANMELIKEINPVVFCWLGGEQKAEANGLRHVYTPFNGGYYINRSYEGVDKHGAGRDGSLKKSITVMPPLHDNLIGIQGTFWTEEVDRPEDLEYLALPRLIGIAEQAWSTQVNKDYDEFLDRIIQHRAYLDLGGYNYGAHQLQK